MFDINNEIELIDTQIRDIMVDYVSIQIDIDDSKIKAAALVAQNLDLKKVLNYEQNDGTKADNLARCIDPQNDADTQLRNLVLPAWCYYTYARCLRMFQGTFTDSGYVTNPDAENREALKATLHEMQSIGDSYMGLVVDFLKEEDSSSSVDQVKVSRRIRTFGGEENRASN